jgi:hypothetical protein
MFWYAPFSCWWETTAYCDENPLEVTFEYLRGNLQEAHLQQPDYYVTLQTWGTWDDEIDDYSRYYTPTPEEISAETMLALAHGVEGVFYEVYYSYYSNAAQTILQEALVELPVNNYATTANWEKVQSLAARLKGTLGNTLLTLDYTGDYINVECYNCPGQDNFTNDYLTINHQGSNYFWHAGFFKEQNNSDNKHFLLTNLRTTIAVTASLTVENQTAFKNVSFTDIEGGESKVDTTIGYNSSITYYENMPAGEGRLYRVSPVVLYGGRMIYDEIVGDMTLHDDMIIENGATLKVYDTYTSKANIIVKDGSIVNGIDGEIIFENGKRLIIDGTATLSGTTEDKLVFVFEGEEMENGIVVNPGASLTISNCKIEDAQTGIKALVNSQNLNFQNVEFIDCKTSSVTLLGQTEGDELVRQIKSCTITNSPIGISASNLPELIVQGNKITNTDLGINLSNISTAIVFEDTIISTTESLAGIFAESTGGEIRNNIIRGHTNGIHLGNSSPDVGGNDITDCLYHGMYVGSGSEPNMVGYLIQNPNNHAWYAISGYNKIYENGGYEGGGSNNDGSEIYISENANVIMS